MDTPDSDFEEHFCSLLTGNGKHLSTLDQFLAERLTQAKINDPQTVIAGIDVFWDLINRNYENLSTRRKNRISPIAWVSQNMTRWTSSLKENQAAPPITLQIQM